MGPWAHRPKRIRRYRMYVAVLPEDMRARYPAMQLEFYGECHTSGRQSHGRSWVVLFLEPAAFIAVIPRDAFVCRLSP